MLAIADVDVHASPETVRAGLSEFEVAPAEMGADTRSYTYLYWRRPDGYICTAPGWPTEYVNQTREGWQPLHAYGEFRTWNPDEPGRPWSLSNEPYRRILLRGGAHEFSVAQVLEHGWHRRAPYPGVSFPQLAGVAHQDVTCATCRRPFLDGADLAKHESVAHREASSQQGLARALSDALRPGDPEALAGVLGQLAQTQRRILELLGGPHPPAPSPAGEGEMKRGIPPLSPALSPRGEGARRTAHAQAEDAHAEERSGR